MPLDERQYNEETTEIMGRMPSWLVRWGLTLIFIIFAGFIIGSYFMKFPQIVSAPITITTINPPADLIAKNSGRIDTILIKDGGFVDENQIVAMLQNSSNFNDVITVKESLNCFNYNDENEWIDVNYSMGDLQSQFSDFRTNFLNYRNYINTDNIGKKIELQKRQIERYNDYIIQSKIQQDLLIESFKYDQAKFKRDSLGYTREVMSLAQYEQAKQLIIQNSNVIESQKATIISCEISLLQMEGQLIELEIQKDSEINSLVSGIKESRSRLLAQIEQWQQNYLFITPTKGVVSYSKYWSSNQNILATEKLATIIPNDTSTVIGIMETPATGFGRVKNNQTVNVKLDGYPYNEYGVVRGVVNRISAVPLDEGYIVEILFPNRLQSTYNKDIELIQQMSGIGEIVTQDERLIVRFINPLRSFFDNIKN